MRYHIERACRLRFSAPAREHHLQIRLAPWHDESQALIRIAVQVEPDTKAVAAYDAFGNLAHHFAVLGAHDELTFTLEADVETRRENPFDFQPVHPARELDWIADSLHQAPRLWDLVLHRGALTPSLPEQVLGRDVPVLQEGVPLLIQVQEAMRWTRAIADYDPEKLTPACDLTRLFEAKRGTAGDLAHLLIAVTRGWRVPARFVSGYVDAAYFDDDQAEGEHLTAGHRPQRLHHWAEVLIPGAGWLGFDPALELLADATYVRVAVGRDGNDIAELRQCSKGRLTDLRLDETLSVSRVPCTRDSLRHRQDEQDRQNS